MYKITCSYIAVAGIFHDVMNASLRHPLVNHDLFRILNMSLSEGSNISVNPLHHQRVETSLGPGTCVAKS